MRTACVALMLSCLLAVTRAMAQDAPAPTLPAPPDPVVRTTISPPDGAVIGQHISLYVDVLFPGDMPHPPRVTVPDLPGAQVMRFESQGTTLSDTVNGTSYVGQRFEFAVFPRRGGPLAIPAPTVTLLDRAGAVTGTLNGQPIEETIDVPDGIDANSLVVATDQLTLEQNWKPDPKSPFKAGDALVRTITRTATDVPALAMRDLAFAAPEGVRVYVDDPLSQDQSERGTITGKRVDRVTYVFEKAGSFDLPAVTQPWWNLADKSADQATGDAATITVTPGPAAAAPGPDGTASAPHPVRPAVWATIAALAILAILFVATAWRKLRARHVRRQAEWAQSEEAAFTAFTKACQGDDAGATYRALADWRSRLPEDWPPPPAAEALEASLFAPDDTTAWSREKARALLDRLQAFRRDVAAGSRPPAPAPLPPLNPA